MSEEREKFEQWASMPPRNLCIKRHSIAEAIKWGEAPGDYVCHTVRSMWMAWHAATDASTHKAIREDEV